MSTVDEANFARGPMASDLKAGVDQLSENQTITFTLYKRLVLPLDGYVFWVKADMLGPSALYNKLRFNRAAYAQAVRVDVAARTFTVQGSLHYSTETRQEAQEVYGPSRIVFTSENLVKELNDIDPDTLWIGEFEGRRFSFSTLGSFYEQSKLWHYVGMAIYADMETQIIDSLSGFDSRSLVVSNSLPAWLAMNSFVSLRGYDALPKLYPAFLSPQNEPPPYATIFIPPESTIALAGAPRIEKNGSHSQLCTDTVKITLWGQRNFNAMNFIDFVYEYMDLTEVMGTMNIPVTRDEQRTQPELQTIAMKKTVEWQVSYHQSQIRDLALRSILSAVPNFYVDGIRL